MILRAPHCYREGEAHQGERYADIEGLGPQEILGGY
jgi:hypothetical protein